MIVTNEEWNALKKERDERQALLERVFGEAPLICHLRFIYDGGGSDCCYLGTPCHVEGRRTDCPFLPFEVKK